MALNGATRSSVHMALMDMFGKLCSVQDRCIVGQRNSECVSDLAVCASAAA